MRWIPASRTARKRFGFRRRREAWLIPQCLGPIGLVLGKNGRGGSGVFVQLQDGGLALLTARHVVFGAVLSGEITVRPAFRHRGLSFEPRRMRIDMCNDAALLFFDPALRVPGQLSFRRWNPAATPPAIAKGDGVIACGLPGEFKGEIDAKRRTIGPSRVLNFWTGVLDPLDPLGDILCDVDPKIRAFPQWLGGVSGGPVFDPNACLVGINRAQNVSKTAPHLRVLPRARLTDLVNMLDAPVPPLDDYRRENWILPCVVKDPSGGPKAKPFRIAFISELYRSRGEPDHDDGRLGEIRALQLRPDAPVPKGEARHLSEQYVLNYFSRFYFDADDEATKRIALKQAAACALNSAEFTPVRLHEDDAMRV